MHRSTAILFSRSDGTSTSLPFNYSGRAVVNLLLASEGADGAHGMMRGWVELSKTLFRDHELTCLAGDFCMRGPEACDAP